MLTRRPITVSRLLSTCIICLLSILVLSYRPVTVLRLLAPTDPLIIATYFQFDIKPTSDDCAETIISYPLILSTYF